MHENQVLSTPNKMVWELFQALRRLCERVVDTQTAADEGITHQDAAICIILAVQCVEVFFNVYFRVLISESAYDHAAEHICSDLEKNQFSLDKKIREWPEHVFGRSLDLGSGPGQRFAALKKMRNKLMHFKSSHESLEVPNLKIGGLADISLYESLTASSAAEALVTAEAFLCEVFALRGIPVEDFPHALHSWTGKIPIPHQQTC